MNENIDIRMGNYLAILSNPQMSANFDPETISVIQRAVSIYVSKTAKAYVEAHDAAQLRNNDILNQFDAPRSFSK